MALLGFADAAEGGRGAGQSAERASGTRAATGNGPDRRRCGHLARLRLARLDLDAGEPRKAVLARLEPITGADRIAAAQELRGDALRALDRLDEARAAYERAMAASSADRPLLEMKRDDLGASIAATRHGAATDDFDVRLWSRRWS
ncbi:MAG: tetratricopeptide repeat protein [Gammaproteobacteria bacterium]|nr:tetratricopeptide repeat protein [Gammaproteobacteria bacterium]